MRGELLNMLIVQRGSPTPEPEWGLVGIPEVSTTSSLDEFNRRIHLSYLVGMRKASRESNIIQKLSKEEEPSHYYILKNRNMQERKFIFSKFNPYSSQSRRL
jgi:hypothetical protein